MKKNKITALLTLLVFQFAPNVITMTKGEWEEEGKPDKYVIGREHVPVVTQLPKVHLFRTYILIKEEKHAEEQTINNQNTNG